MAGGAHGIARNAAALAAATLLARLAMFGLGVVLARQLGVADYGRYGLGIALASITVALTDVGASSYLAREAARSRAGALAQLTRLARGRLITAVAGNAIVLAGVLLLVRDGRTELALAIALVSAAFDGLAQFAFGWFQGREQLGFQSRLTSATSLARAGGGMVIALTTGSLFAVLAWTLAAGIAQAAVSARRLAVSAGDERHAVPQRDPVWRTVVAMGAVTVLVMVSLRADTVLVGALQGESEAAFYTAAWTLVAGLQVVPWTLSVALAPVFARTHGSDREAYVRTWDSGLRAALVIGAPMAVICCALADPLVGLLFGDDYDAAAGALAILAFSIPPAALNSVSTLALRGAGLEGVLLRVVGLGAAANVATNLVVIPAYGIEGAAAVNVGTEVLVAAIVLLYAARRGVAPLPRLGLGRAAVALVALAATALLLRGAVPVLVAAAASAAVYAAVALAGRLVTVAELRALRRPPAAP